MCHSYRLLRQISNRSIDRLNYQYPQNEALLCKTLGTLHYLLQAYIYMQYIGQQQLMLLQQCCAMLFTRSRVTTRMQYLNSTTRTYVIVTDYVHVQLASQLAASSAYQVPQCHYYQRVQNLAIFKIHDLSGINFSDFLISSSDTYLDFYSFQQ